MTNLSVKKKRIGRARIYTACTAAVLIAALSVTGFAQTAPPASSGQKPASGQMSSSAAWAAIAGDAGADAGRGATAPTSAAPPAASGDAGALRGLYSTEADGGLPAVPTLAPPVTRKTLPPPPPPSDAQVKALDQLKTEADVYEQGARDYRDTVTTIIKLHYETKKRSILAGLDHELATEKEELRKARDTAIQRLEEFIAKYSGPRAHPEATPDAMYRLAALYEERARSEDAKDDLSVGLKPAIGLYKRVIVEFPKYRELAGIYYFLGHAYNDSGRTDEAQQVWRSLVCHNKYPYPTPPDPKNPDADSITPMPQDNTVEYWRAWRARHQKPASAKNANPENRFTDPYASCEAIPQPELKPGDEPKYVAEVWWQIGNWEFDNLDMKGGVVPEEIAAVWDYNRAASAYTHSLQFKKPPLYGVALYKYAWTLFKQQRYEGATKEFVHLLLYTDDQQKLTGDPGADFRSEAYTYIAGSLTNIDFTGPGPEEPFIQRPDIVDTEPKPEVAEAKLHIAVTRVQDPNLIPQDKPWTIEIYKALAQEFRSLNQFNNAIEVYESILKKWPMDPTAPDVQNAIAETYDQMNMTKRPNTPEHDAIAAKALEARTKLANYIGNTPWVDANKENPAAIQNAERLVKGGLRQAAAQHTNNGKQLLVSASSTSDAKDQLELLSRAQAEYKLAALGWYGFLKQDENAPDAYESRYWLADARHNELRISVILHKLQPQRSPEPTQDQIEGAKIAAIDVRDSNEDDKYLDNAAFFVVDESDVYRDLEYQRFDDSKGSLGIQKRDSVRFDNDGPDKKVQRDPIPNSVQGSILARDEYVQRVPSQLDVNKRSLDYQLYSADTYFVYGHFDEARPRYEAMYKAECGKTDYGYKAWEKLISMSNMERDVDRSRQLAEAEKAHSCAITAADKSARDFIVNPTLQEAAYVDARKKFKQAKDAPPGPEKQKLWREAAGMYEAALSAAPGRDEAPEAAMNAAYAYKQVGDFNKAIELYNKFIAEYGSDARLDALQKGDPKSKTAPNPKQYQERLGYLGTAYDELGTTYYGFFNYQKAAETYDKVAQNNRFEAGKRKEAAKNAMILYANMGQRDKMHAEYTNFVKLSPTAEERANADFLVADYDHKQWDPNSPDTGTNRQNRLAAQNSLAAFYNANKGKRDASRYVLQAAYFHAKMQKTASDKGYKTWFKNTIAAWDGFRAAGFATKDGKLEATTPPFSDYGAEAEYTLADDEIKANYETDRHKYTGATEDVIGSVDKNGRQIKTGKYQTNAKAAEKYDQELEHVTATYPSLEWVPAALARQGALYDTLRSGLYNATTPPIKLFTTQQESMLKKLEASNRDDLINKADEIRSTVKEAWRSKRDKELAAADEVMVRRYATAVSLAKQYNVRNPAVTHAIERLAYFTDILGDAKMREYVTKTKDPNDPSKTRNLDYRDGQYVQSRPGITSVPQASGQSSPLPVAP